MLSWLWLFTSVTPRNVEKPSNWTPSIYMHSASFVISSVAVLIVLFTNVMGGSSSNAFGSFLSMAGVVTSAISVRFVIPFLSRHNKQGIYEMEGIIGFTCSPGDCCCPGATGGANMSPWRRFFLIRRLVDVVALLMVLVLHGLLMILFMMEESHVHQPGGHDSSSNKEALVVEITAYSGVLITLSIEYFKTTMELVMILVVKLVPFLWQELQCWRGNFGQQMQHMCCCCCQS